jgi:hypothetical protein
MKSQSNNNQFESFGEEPMMFEVENRDMPSVSTGGWEIVAILTFLMCLMGILWKA